VRIFNKNGEKYLRNDRLYNDNIKIIKINNKKKLLTV
jgi:hypothetical protein